MTSGALMATVRFRVIDQRSDADLLKDFRDLFQLTLDQKESMDL